MQHQDAPARAAYDGTCLIVEDSEFDRKRLRRVLARAYGGYVHRVIGDAAADPSALGEHFGAGLHAREVAWLMDHEWARTAEDVLWRRTKLGLRIDAAGVRRLDAWMQARRSARLAA